MYCCWYSIPAKIIKGLPWAVLISESYKKCYEEFWKSSYLTLLIVCERGSNKQWSPVASLTRAPQPVLYRSLDHVYFPFMDGLTINKGYSTTVCDELQFVQPWEQARPNVAPANIGQTIYIVPTSVISCSMPSKLYIRVVAIVIYVLISTNSPGFWLPKTVFLAKIQ